LSADAPTVLSALLAVQRINRSGISERLFNVDTDLILADGVRAEIIFVHSDLLRYCLVLGPWPVSGATQMTMTLSNYEMIPLAYGMETAKGDTVTEG
jgi:hypothetical protein